MCTPSRPIYIGTGVQRESVRFLPLIIGVFAAVALACSTPTEPIQVATSTFAPPQRTTAGVAAAATATPYAPLTAVPPPTATPSPAVVQIEFPDWADESPELTTHIMNSSVIVRARFLSLVATVKKENSYSHEAELVYRFDVIQFVKGSPSEELTVRMSSGPKYIAFPDWIGNRTEVEAERLAEDWLRRNPGDFVQGEEGILFLHGPYRGGDYQFASYESGEGYGGYPIVGETWLNKDNSSMYQHTLTDEEYATISHAEIYAKVKATRDMSVLEDRQYAFCLARALARRSRVRAQIEGTYRELTVGGYAEPKPFPRFLATMKGGNQGTSTVFEFLRPPYRSLRFSIYWLDGKDKDLFAIRASSDTEGSYESLIAVRPLPVGVYNVHFSQYHESLPCRGVPWADNDYWTIADTMELVVTVTDPQ